MAEIDDLVCEERVIHVEAVRDARRDLPAPRTVVGLVELFSALGDPTRLRIISSLAARELCVCDLAAAIGQSESAVSHHLRLLRNLGLVRSRRDGRRVYYALDDEHVSGLFTQAIDHVNHQDVHPQQT